MTSNAVIDDIDLKARLAYYGIFIPITNSTRKVLLKKLHKLEMGSVNVQTSMDMDDKMDTSNNGMTEYEIREKMSELGYNIPLTDSTRPVISNMIRKKK